MTTKLQPPVGTVIETREDAIRILLSPKYVEFTLVNYGEVDAILQDSDGDAVMFSAIVFGRELPYTVTGVLDGFTEDPNFSMRPRVEQITIKAGKMSWEKWKEHFERMSARDAGRLCYDSDIMESAYSDCFGINQLQCPTNFPAKLKQDFTYTPVYPLEPCTSTSNPQPPLYIGRLFYTWEELDEVVKAYGLTDESLADCFMTSAGVVYPYPKRLIDAPELYDRTDSTLPWSLPWTLIRMPNVEGALQVDRSVYTMEQCPSQDHCNVIMKNGEIFYHLDKCDVDAEEIILNALNAYGVPCEAEAQQESLPYKFAVYLKDWQYKTYDTYEEAREASERVSQEQGESTFIVVGGHTVETKTTVTERTF